VEVFDPLLFVAVNVYIVLLAVGLTERLVPVTIPIAGLIDTVVAPVTCQDSVEDSPELIVPGLALNEEIVGILTVMVTERVVDPLPFVAVSM
jgi:hypothetical protein